jgi:hypothetical protein
VLRSGGLREALGSDGEKARGDKALMMISQIPERFASLANRSGKIVQVPAPAHASPAFGSDSRGRVFFDEEWPPAYLGRVVCE